MRKLRPSVVVGVFLACVLVAVAARYEDFIVGKLTVENTATFESTVGVTGALTASGGVVGDVTGDTTGGAVISASNDLVAVSDSGAETNIVISDGVVDGEHIADDTITEAKLSAATQDKIAYTAITVVDGESAGTGTVTIQLKDAAGNDLAARAIVETWIGDEDDYLPDAETDYSVSTGGSLQEIVANAHYKAVTDASGTVVMDVDCGGLSTNYVWASVGGRIVASGEVVFTAP